MNDPWGSSPWADEAQLPVSVKTKADAPRPTTPIRAPKLGLDEKIISPWGDDNENDGFGHWAPLPEQPGQTLELDGSQDDGWGSHPIHAEELNKGHSDALSTGWNAHHIPGEEKSSPLAPNPVPGASGFMRPPSPDPWAREEGALKQDVAPSAVDQEEQTSHNLMIPGNERTGGLDLEVSHSSNEIEVPDIEHGNEKDTTVGEDVSSNAKAQDTISKDSPDQELEGSSRTESQESDPVSRPSSSPSERSHHDDLPQESPRTSFDEDPKLNRPQVPRKVSTKVQELVQHFDTLAKKDEVEPVIIRNTSAQGTNIQEDSGEDDDFGDFEEGQTDDDESEVGENEGSEQVSSHSPVKDTFQHQRTRSLENASTKDCGIIEYPFDASKLDKLYAIDNPDPTSESVFIPDSIPFESFSSTEQRKTWYRISRYGTMRRHNSGNDENYIRVGWKSSVIRDDTLKIVSRWIEEDRISGRVLLGGGSKGNTVFGWNDPKAPAVPLSDVFVKHGKKMTNMITAVEATPEVPREWPKGLVRQRSTSKTISSSSKPRRKSSVKAISVALPSETQDIPVSGDANFGWNLAAGAVQLSSSDSQLAAKGDSNILSGPVSHPNPASPPRKSASPSNDDSTYLPASLNALQTSALPATLSIRLPISLAQNSIPLPTLSTTHAVNDDDDNDDWGEMVSTRATPTLPSLLPSKGSRHKKSQSIGEDLTAASHKGVSNGRTSGQLDINHQPSTSFDEILTPRRAAPPSTSLPDTTTVDLFPHALGGFQTPAPTSTSDPWASADLSFFETTTAPVRKSVPIPTPKATGLRNVTFNIPISVPPVPKQRSHEELEQDLIVQKVVKGLPDLSYMLRK